MIIDKTSDIEVEKFGVTRSQEAKISQDSLAHIMTVLTRLYSDPWLAIIREYSTNAHDSHIMKGESNLPIDVKLPGRLKPIFAIRDYGIGLSEDDIFNLFSHYGASLKRESNDFNGCLGLGSKSAWAAVSQFTITSWHNCKKIMYSAFKNERGIGEISKLGEWNCSEDETGVEIQVPIPSDMCDEFKRKALEFYYTFPIKPNIHGVTFKHISEATPRHNFGHGIKQYSADDIPYRLSATGYSGVIMGGVLYPIKNPRDYNIPPRFLIEAKIGDVHFSPDREDLEYNKATEHFLRVRGRYIRMKLVKDYLDAIKDVNYFCEAAREWNKVDQNLKYILSNAGHQAAWQGIQFNEYIYGTGYIDLEANKHYSEKGYVRGTSSIGCMFGDYDAEEIFCITGYKREPSKEYREQLVQWMEKNGYKRAIIVGGEEGLIKGQTTRSGSKLEKIFDGIEVLTKKEMRKLFSSGSRKTYTNKTFKSRNGYIAQKGDKNLVYYLKSEYAPKDFRAITGKDIFQIYKKDLSKFLKQFPGSKHASVALEEYLQNWFKGLDTEQKNIVLLAKDGVLYNFLNNSKLNALSKHYMRLSDPKIRDIFEVQARIAKFYNENQKRIKTLENYHYNHLIGKTQKSDTSDVKEVESILPYLAKNYRLYDEYMGRFGHYASTNGSIIEEFLFYMNEKYEKVIKRSKNK